MAWNPAQRALDAAEQVPPPSASQQLLRGTHGCATSAPGGSLPRWGPSLGGVSPRWGPSPCGGLSQVGSLPRWGLDMLLVQSNCSFCISAGLNVELGMASAGPPSRNSPLGHCTFWGSESWAWGVLRSCRMPSSGLLGMVGGHSCCSLEHRRCPGSSLWGGGLARVH